MGQLAQSIVVGGPLDDAAQTAARRLPDLREHLCHNHKTVLSDETFLDLMTGKPKLKAPDACGLAKRTLSDVQLGWLLDHETRASVLVVAIGCNSIPPALQRRFAQSKTCTRTAAAALLARDDCLPDLRADLARIAGGNELLEWAASDDSSATDAEAIELLDTFAQWGVSYNGRNGSEVARRNRLLARLFENRPQVIAHAVALTAPHELAQAAAGSRRLTDVALQWHAARLTPGQSRALTDEEKAAFPYLYQALGHNPVCHIEVLEAMVAAYKATDPHHSVVRSLEGRLSRTRSRPTIVEPYESVSDPELLDWLVRRSVPSTFEDRTTKGRPFDLAALACNEHLNEDHARRIQQALRTPLADELGSTRLAAAKANLTAKFPQLAWRDEDFTVAPPPPLVDVPDSSLELDSVRAQAAGQVRISNLGWAGKARTDGVSYITARLATQPDPEAAWLTLLGMVDSFDPATLLEEAVDLAILVLQ